MIKGCSLYTGAPPSGSSGVVGPYVTGPVRRCTGRACSSAIKSTASKCNFIRPARSWMICSSVLSCVTSPFKPSRSKVMRSNSPRNARCELSSASIRAIRRSAAGSPVNMRDSNRAKRSAIAASCAARSFFD